MPDATLFFSSTETNTFQTSSYERNISIISYTIQLLLTVIYSIVIYYIDTKLFENKEF